MRTWHMGAELLRPSHVRLVLRSMKNALPMYVTMEQWPSDLPCYRPLEIFRSKVSSTQLGHPQK